VLFLEEEGKQGLDFIRTLNTESTYIQLESECVHNRSARFSLEKFFLKEFISVFSIYLEIFIGSLHLLE